MPPLFTICWARGVRTKPPFPPGLGGRVKAFPDGLGLYPATALADSGGCVGMLAPVTEPVWALVLAGAAAGVLLELVADPHATDEVVPTQITDLNGVQ